MRRGGLRITKNAQRFVSATVRRNGTADVTNTFSRTTVMNRRGRLLGAFFNIHDQPPVPSMELFTPFFRDQTHPRPTILPHPKPSFPSHHQRRIQTVFFCHITCFSPLLSPSFPGEPSSFYPVSAFRAEGVSIQYFQRTAVSALLSKWIFLPISLFPLEVLAGATNRSYNRSSYCIPTSWWSDLYLFFYL